MVAAVAAEAADADAAGVLTAQLAADCVAVTVAEAVEDLFSWPCT